MKKTNKKGFTIVELVIVIAVIAILAGVLIPTFTSVTNRAKESAALQKARTAYTAITVYDIDAKQDNVADNEVGENYIINVDGFNFEVANGELATVPSTEEYDFDAEYDEKTPALEDLADGLTVYVLKPAAVNP